MDKLKKCQMRIQSCMDSIEEEKEKNTGNSDVIEELDEIFETLDTAHCNLMGYRERKDVGVYEDS